MRPDSPLCYEARLGLGLNALLAGLMLPAYATLQWYLWVRSGSLPPPLHLLRAFELILPLSAALGAAHLMLIEREEGFHELRLSYPENRWRLPLLRTAWALALTLLGLAVGAVLFRLGYGPYPLDETVVPALAPILALLGLSLLVGNLTGSYWVAAGAAMSWWLLDAVSRGTYTRLFFLFNATWPCAGVDPTVNRWLLALLGLALLAVNAGLSARRTL
ncbi:MAG: hypothetical protein ACOY93_03235 [Bacillota bacterium]